MKSVLISIKPKWCELIANGKKTIEVRKTSPKCDTPFKCYIYCTKNKGISFWTGKRYAYADDISHNLFDVCGNGKVIGEFVCDNIYPIAYTMDGFADFVDCETSCLKPRDFIAYGKGKRLYGWHISDLVIYDKPKELSEFRKPLICHRGIQNDSCIGCWDCEIKKPPQSWCYCEEGFCV